MEAEVWTELKEKAGWLWKDAGSGFGLLSSENLFTAMTYLSCDVIASLTPYAEYLGPPYSYFFYFLAASTAFARVYRDAHRISDVIGGVGWVML